MTIAYISDIHIEFIVENRKRRGLEINPSASAVAELFKNEFDQLQETRKMTGKSSIDYVVVAGDVSHCKDDIWEFFGYLEDEMTVPVLYVLGNHDIWNWTSSFDTFFDGKVFVLPSQWQLMEDGHMAHFNKLKNVRMLKLGKKIELVKDDEKLTVIGDLGYSGLNADWNASNGLYRYAMEGYDEDIQRTNAWRKFYQKTLDQRKENEKILVITHTPIEDWMGSYKPDLSGNTFYINGHTHGEHGYHTSYTYRDDAQNGYEATGFHFGILNTSNVKER